MPTSISIPWATVVADSDTVITFGDGYTSGQAQVLDYAFSAVGDTVDTLQTYYTLTDNSGNVE